MRTLSAWHGAWAWSMGGAWGPYASQKLSGVALRSIDVRSPRPPRTPIDRSATPDDMNDD
eukprot:1248030-Prymnesium_polylepis.1